MKTETLKKEIENDPCWENGFITESDLMIQCSNCQNSNDILHRNRKKIF
jgi:hypothetical protein